MVTRPGHGGQRRDVATAVLDIMRERYEMAERVYYHHKKCAASAMLAKLAELCPGSKPADDETIYPAPWTHGDKVTPKHMAHFSDAAFIDYLGNAKVTRKEEQELQQRLYMALRYRRTDMYRTLLVVDVPLVDKSKLTVEDFAKQLRGTNESPSNEGRLALETKLAERAGGKQGDVLVYCAPPDMQSKEVDARVEIQKDIIKPLRLHRQEFAYWDDIVVLQQYYKQLWRAYVFVSPELFDDVRKCKQVVDAFCDHFGIQGEARVQAYTKVRTHKFDDEPEALASRKLDQVHFFVDRLEYPDLPIPVLNKLLHIASTD